MGVTLSAAASLSLVVRRGRAGRGHAAGRRWPPDREGGGFLPYLGGERTPHNDGALRAAFAGRRGHEADRAALTQAVLEGVAFSLRDCLDALAASGTVVRGEAGDVIGGGSPAPPGWGSSPACSASPCTAWPRASTAAPSGRPGSRAWPSPGKRGKQVCTPPARAETFLPDPVLTAAYAARLPAYRGLNKGIAGVVREG